MHPTTLTSTFGCQSEVASIKRLLLKHPRDAFRSQITIDQEWEALNYTSRPNYEQALADYDTFVQFFEQLGIEIHFLPPSELATLDAIYTHDPLQVTKRGAILCNMGKLERHGEPAAMQTYLEEIGIPLLGAITGEGRLEGGDVVWLDERTVAIGEGYRTNAEGIHQFTELLGDLVDEVITVPLPHWNGPDDVLHLMSFISPIDEDLAVVYSRLMPVPFRQYLVNRGMQFVEVPDEEYDSMACNVLAVAPRKAIMVDGNPITQARLEAQGVEVWTYDGTEISHKGEGGPTCLTRPLLRT